MDRSSEEGMDIGWMDDFFSGDLTARRQLRPCIFRARAYSQLIQSGDDDYLMNETIRGV